MGDGSVRSANNRIQGFVCFCDNRTWESSDPALECHRKSVDGMDYPTDQRRHTLRRSPAFHAPRQRRAVRKRRVEISERFIYRRNPIGLSFTLAESIRGKVFWKSPSGTIGPCNNLSRRASEKSYQPIRELVRKIQTTSRTRRKDSEFSRRRAAE